MDDDKCDKDCENCNLNEKITELIKKAISDKRPVLVLAEVTDEMSTILMHGDEAKVARMLLSAMDSDERLEGMFMQVMSIRSRQLLKEVLGKDLIGELKSKMEEHNTSTPKAEC